MGYVLGLIIIVMEKKMETTRDYRDHKDHWLVAPGTQRRAPIVLPAPGLQALPEESGKRQSAAHAEVLRAASALAQAELVQRAGDARAFKPTRASCVQLMASAAFTLQS